MEALGCSLFRITSLLSFVASMLLRKKRWILWSMDLYPEGFVSGGLISQRNPIQRLYQKVLSIWPPDHLLCLGENQAQYLKKNYYPKLSSTVLPIGLRSRSLEIKTYPHPEWHDPQKVIFGYLGSLGEAHDHKLIQKFIEHLDPQKHHVVLSLRGAYADSFDAVVSHVGHVTLVDYIPDDSCQLIDIQIVSLRKQWTHICVPSKAISALQFGSAILYFGSAQSDTWHYIKQAGWLMDNDASIEDFLSTLDRSEINDKRANAKNRANELSSLYFERQSELVDILKTL